MEKGSDDSPKDAALIEAAQETKKDASERKRPKKRFSRKMKGLIIAVVIIVIALIIGLWGSGPAPYTTVNDVVGNSDPYLDKTIEIRGTVEDWNASAKTFNLTGTEGNIIVTYVIVPEGFNNGKDVVVKGILKNDNGLVMESSDIQVGCPSKY
jgi:cytochrome c-type biogenesis protein CcmE